MALTSFLSFKNRTVFDFSSTKYGILNTSNVISENDILKGALFIGPNASGKSNALKGIRFLLDFLMGENANISSYDCLFYADNGSKHNIVIEYEFNIVNEDLKYVIEYNTAKGILEEHLDIAGKEILNRIGENATIILDEKISEKNINGNTSYLRRASFETGKFPQNKILNSFMEFILNSYYVDVHSLNYSKNMNVEQYARENGVRTLNRYINKLLYDFTLEYDTKSSGEGVTINAGDNKLLFFKRNSYPIPIPFQQESLGNRVFANLLPGLIGAIEKKGMFIIDEFSSGLHNVLEEKIVRFFMENAGHSQLFFTSHSTNLISNSIMRPDQIYVVSFNGKEGSTIKRVSDYKPREAQNIEKMYLSGVFEGLPVYGEEL